ncbi:MAG: alpha/beta hydrolase [Acidobacteriota bacterium]
MKRSTSEQESRVAATSNGHSVKPPSLGYLLMEGRALGELLTTYAVMPMLRRGPQGDGHPVLVFPGFLASDISTGPLRKFLNKAGFSALPWRMGRNFGPRNGLEDRLLERLRDLRQRYDQRVSLVGWSLGGIYARLLANRSPDDVRSVITLGTPFNTHHKANRSWRLFEWVSGTEIDDVEPLTFRQIRDTPPVPTTSIYSLTDGVVAWRSSIDEEGPQAENIQVPGSHIGLGANPLVLHAILDRLAQAEGAWQKFDRAGAKRLFYRKPRDPSEAAAQARAETAEAAPDVAAAAHRA